MINWLKKLLRIKEPVILDLKPVTNDVLFRVLPAPVRKTDIDRTEGNHVYLIKLSNDEETFYKIGISIDPLSRWKDFLRTHPRLEVVDLIETDHQHAVQIESEYKRLNAPNKYEPMWVMQSGNTECFSELLEIVCLSQLATGDIDFVKKGVVTVIEKENYLVPERPYRKPKKKEPEESPWSRKLRSRKKNPLPVPVAPRKPAPLPPTWRRPGRRYVDAWL